MSNFELGIGIIASGAFNETRIRPETAQRRSPVPGQRDARHRRARGYHLRDFQLYKFIGACAPSLTRTAVQSGVAPVTDEITPLTGRAVREGIAPSYQRVN